MQTILVCDDDKEIVEAIEIYLQQEGFHVLKAYDGEEALEILKNNEVHLLIMDVMMPKLDGIRATLKIREKQYSDHHFVSKNRGLRQDLRTEYRGGRLCGETVQSAGTGGKGEIPAPPLYAAWKCSRIRR